MGIRGSTATAAGAAAPSRHDDGGAGAHRPRHAAPAPADAADDGDGGEGRHLPPPRGLTAAVRDRLPRGNTLDDGTFRHRHRVLWWVLVAHLPALAALGTWRGHDPGPLALELLAPAACAVAGWFLPARRPASFAVTAGFVASSVVLVHLSGGRVEARFHAFVLIGLVALYQDWAPFLWNVVLTVVALGATSVAAHDVMFDHDAAHERPLLWSGIHVAALLAASSGVVTFWSHAEREQRRNLQLVEDLAAAEAAKQQAVSGLLVNLARRNQSLLDRQLDVIGDVSQRVDDADLREQVRQLEQLATRIRRNAGSLLVLAGDDTPRRWSRPVPLVDVVRAAAAEVEDGHRVEPLVNDHLQVEGRAAADLVHLLAELIDNAVTFSPPTATVRVRSHLSPDDPPMPVVSIEDSGIGMTEPELRNANLVLAEAPEVDLGRSPMLGFHVVARLARRHALSVRLAPTPGGGLTAMVTLAPGVVTERSLGSTVTTTDGGSGSTGTGATTTTGRHVLAPWSAVTTRPVDDGPRVETIGLRPTGTRAREGDRHEGRTAGTGPVFGTGPAPGTGPGTSGAAPADPTGPPGTLPPVVLPALPAASEDTHQLPAASEPPAPGKPRRGGSPRVISVSAREATGTEPASTTAGPSPSTVAGPAAGHTPPAEAASPAPASGAAAGQGPATAPSIPLPAAGDRPFVPAGAAPDTPSGGPRPAPWWFESERLVRHEEPAGAEAGGPAPDPDEPATTAGGLARRVPGANLASLRRNDPPEAPPAAPAAGTPGRDPERTRTMLSRFQASQRAGRLVAGTPGSAPPPPPTDRSEQEHP